MAAANRTGRGALALVYPDAPHWEPVSSVAAAREERYRDGELAVRIYFDNG